MKFLLALAFFLTTPLAVFSQDIKTEINGEWILCGSSASLLAPDTVILHCDITYAEVKRCCNVLEISFLKHSRLRVSDATRCEEPGIVKTFNDAKTYRLSKEKGSWVLTIVAGKKHLRYLVVSLRKQEISEYPFEVKTLKIIKI